MLTDGPVFSSTLPSEYSNLVEAFSKSRASELPPHHSSGYAIDLLPDAAPPKCRIFPLSQTESDAMKNYINEVLSKGFKRMVVNVLASITEASMISLLNSDTLYL